ncbi:DNA alkylation repair protein [Sulfitobacter sp. S190]|uniref:DNA alkylation repair protein n=1 Tax=Sulfitobacter sp. S190 TaxID=2867022 RepID=UPI0021A68BAF|nr:DNA alkylation repair protein [Sulfitobacter sp. S190]UWR23709.1 DNA alkylation repair protein [Sulfitobacter sp. S190]
MAERFSLKDHLFNPQTVAQLAEDFARGVPGFDGDAFTAKALGGFDGRELLERLDWLADCAQAQLAGDFPTMADQLEAALPPPLDPTLRDDDFGQFIHAVPGILAVRHGLEHHRDRALDLLYAATQRFSMEFYIRPFLNRWPAETLARLHEWAQDDNYHVRRLVSEGTRPRLPWAKSVRLNPDQTLPLLTRLHGDPTRYVTRSVANHLNDIAKTDPDRVLGTLDDWQAREVQAKAELDWMRRHALRTLIKQGHPGAMAALGYRQDVPLSARITPATGQVAIGDVLPFTVTLAADVSLPVLVDYRIGFARPGAKTAQKVFKLKTARISAGTPLELTKKHRFKGDATTFTLHPGVHTITVQVNGLDVCETQVTLTG